MIADHTFRQAPAADAELQHRVQSVCNKFCDNVHIIANEPTLACYRLEEHVRKSTPVLVERRITLTKNDRLLEGRVFDLEYDLKAVKQIYPAETRFCSVKETLKNAIFMKQELDKTARERKIKVATEKKMKRLSGSFDVRSDTRSLERSSPVPIAAAGEPGQRNSPSGQPGSARSSLYSKMSTPTR